MSESFDNPLMPKARLRQIYVAMVQARALGRELAGRRGAAPTAGMEACLVSTSIDLSPRDLVSDALTHTVVGYLRGTGLTSLLSPNGPKTKPRAGTVSGCGSAARLAAGDAAAANRIWLALGAAAALKSAAAAAKTPADDATKQPSGVVVAYFAPAEAAGAAWAKSLAFAARHELPIVFVVLPGTAEGRVGAAARKSGVPGIAVDGDDAAAIYRVAQESIGRARMGGGAALIECVPFRLAGAPPAPPADAIATLAAYMLHGKVVTQAWMDGAARTFARRIALARRTALPRPKS